MPREVLKKGIEMTIGLQTAGSILLFVGALFAGRIAAIEAEPGRHVLVKTNLTYW